ncbi:Homeobox protein knotted-1-like 4 isoform B [Glycine soja]|uniref:Homeobox protein knotted-1-like 4 isoform B n=1 Tax=Glycine soja TaxID=3848 RepID=A0A445H4W2_GLYSO|nr:Homeobox protein knotted-1-like 4 isoform B [Glycine soja]
MAKPGRGRRSPSGSVSGSSSPSDSGSSSRSRSLSRSRSPSRSISSSPSSSSSSRSSRSRSPPPQRRRSPAEYRDCAEDIAILEIAPKLPQLQPSPAEISFYGVSPGEGTGATMSDDEDEQVGSDANLFDGALDGPDSMGFGPLIPTENERSLTERVRPEVKHELKQETCCALVTCWSWVRIRKQPLCICKGKAAYNIPPPYLRIAKSLWAMGYEVFICVIRRAREGSCIVATKTESNKVAGNAILYECVQTIMSIEDNGGLHIMVGYMYLPLISWEDSCQTMTTISVVFRAFLLAAGIPNKDVLLRKKRARDMDTGMVAAARWIKKHCTTILLEDLCRHPDFQIKVANHLDRMVSTLRRNPLKVLVQVNTSGEESKSGIDPSNCVDLINTKRCETQKEKKKIIEKYFKKFMIYSLTQPIQKLVGISTKHNNIRTLLVLHAAKEVSFTEPNKLLYRIYALHTGSIFSFIYFLNPSLIFLFNY